ncbi:MAG: 2-amino-4-hydroxy-6-hydroxymethyldihydropteridine diphosphokinase [Burkholderiales bacterium]|jgi:2-amino-4-hydroxy-6-hydroxymethyldihydropteridine diphosphokinase
MNLEDAYIALGSNLKNPADQVRAGFEELAMLPDTLLAAISSLYSNPAVGYVDQPDFVNAVAKIQTGLAPRALLAELLAIERRFGRVREFENAPRTLDLDIVLYGSETIDEPGLTVPHPRMHERAFVIVPLAEIAPDLVVPGRGPIATLLRGVDQGSLTKLASQE